MSSRPERSAAQERAAWDRTARPLHALIFGLAALAVALATLALSPGDAPHLVAFLGDDVNVPCTLRTTLGVPCWACGMTRAFVHGARGHLAAAWGYNPAGLVLLGVVALQLPYRAVRMARPGVLPGTWQPDVAVAAAALVLTLAVWVARLLGAWPLPLPLP